jgi:hypothetical protein
MWHGEVCKHKNKYQIQLSVLWILKLWKKWGENKRKCVYMCKKKTLRKPETVEQNKNGLWNLLFK